MNSIEFAKKILTEEANAISGLLDVLNEEFEQAVNMIHRLQGKLIITGVGKSGHIGRKMASTFSSTGTPSFFIHPSEASHGDLGMIDANDIVLGISYSGNSSDLFDLLNYCQRKEVPVISITGNRESVLAKSSQVCLEARISREADPLGLAPTTSTTTHLALGDALALSVSNLKGFKPENFAEFHPGGTLGKKLLTQVKHLMHSGDAVPIVNPQTEFLEVVNIMTSHQVVGVAGVVENDQLAGIITDGDIRRQLTHGLSTDLKARDIMTKSPITIDQDEMAERSLRIMEEKKIQFLFVVNSEGKPVGAIRILDLLSFGLK